MKAGMKINGNEVEIKRSMRGRWDLYINNLSMAYIESQMSYTRTPLGSRRARWDIELTVMWPERKQQTFKSCAQSPKEMLIALASQYRNREDYLKERYGEQAYA